MSFKNQIILFVILIHTFVFQYISEEVNRFSLHSVRQVPRLTNFFARLLRLKTEETDVDGFSSWIRMQENTHNI